MALTLADGYEVGGKQSIDGYIFKPTFQLIKIKFDNDVEAVQVDFLGFLFIVCLFACLLLFLGCFGVFFVLFCLGLFFVFVLFCFVFVFFLGGGVVLFWFGFCCCFDQGK